MHVNVKGYMFLSFLSLYSDSAKPLWGKLGFPFVQKLSIIIDNQSKLPVRIFSMTDHEKSYNRTTLTFSDVLAQVVSQANDKSFYNYVLFE